MTDDEKKYSQAEVDEIIAKYADYNDIKAERDTLKTENDAMKADIEKKDGEILDALRIEVARSFKLPSGLAARLSGTSREELEADAKSLAEAMGPKEKIGEATNPAKNASKPFTKAVVKGMSRDEIIANMPAIKAQMKAGTLV